MGFSFSGMMQGAGAGLTNYGQMLHEQEKMDWETQRDNVRWEREAHFKQLEAKAARSQHTEDLKMQSQFRSDDIETQAKYRSEDKATEAANRLEGIKMQTDASRANAAESNANRAAMLQQGKDQHEESMDLRNKEYELRAREQNNKDGKVGQPTQGEIVGAIEASNKHAAAYLEELDPKSDTYKRIQKSMKEENPKADTSPLGVQSYVADKTYKDFRVKIGWDKPTNTPTPTKPTDTPLKGAPEPKGKTVDQIVDDYNNGKHTIDQIAKDPKLVEAINNRDPESQTIFSNTFSKLYRGDKLDSITPEQRANVNLQILRSTLPNSKEASQADGKRQAELDQWARNTTGGRMNFTQLESKDPEAAKKLLDQFNY